MSTNGGVVKGQEEILGRRIRPWATACLMAGVLGAASCAAKAGNAGRLEVTIDIDAALMLDLVHVEVTAEGKEPLIKDLPATLQKSIKWSILMSNAKAGTTATLVGRGMRDGNTLVTYTAYAQVGPGKTVQVLLRLKADCAAIGVCPNPDQTCDNGMCVKKPIFGNTGDAGVDAAGRDTAQDTPDDGAGTVGIDGGDGDDVAPTVKCAVDQHLCGDRCVANNDVRTCGTSCSPCDLVPDGTPSCDGIKCGADCPAGKKLCKGGCIDTAAACDGACPTGTHACLAACPSDQSVNACGTSCNPCVVPAGASQATCDGTTCDFQCTTGYHKCGTACARDEDATACGLACTRCPTDPNGAAQCVGGACSLRCSTGFHVCGGRCVSDTSIDTCGTSCNACLAPMGGTATCQAGQCGVVCPAGKKACLGMCIDTTAACSGVCPASTHNCTGNCVSDTSVNSCGPTACTTCPVPPGASQATCDGTKCDFTCGPGFHRCGTACAADSSAAACGTACTVCPADPNGTAACIGGACGLMCKSGFHLCAGVCVSNAAVATCGPTSCAACQAPTAGTVTCDGLACVPACPPGTTKLCSGACIPNANACNGVCPAGSHACAGVCASNTAIATCGASCMPCPAPTNGSATCNGTVCGIVCNTGFHNCGGACVSNSNISSCGATACTACPQPTNASATCNGTACGIVCNTGFHNCSGACVSNTSTSSCGTSCTACIPPASSTPTCNGTSCGFSCNATLHPCGAACASNTDATRCGASCTSCSQLYATAACNGTTGTCQNTCLGFTLACPAVAGKPVCGTWDFESNTTEGWLNTSFANADASAGQFSVTTTRALTGTHSLSIGHQNPAAVFALFSNILIDFCPTKQPQALSGRILSLSMFFAPSGATPSTDLNLQNNSELFVRYHNGIDHQADSAGDSALDPIDYPTMRMNQWTVVKTFPLPAGLTAIEILFRTYNNAWTGTIYFDNIHIE